MEKYYIIFDNEQNIIFQPMIYADGTAIVTNFNYMVGKQDAITAMFPDAIFSE